MSAKPTELVRPRQFWSEYHEQLPLRTYSSFKYHLQRRNENGLIASGAVVESPSGCFIRPGRLLGDWLNGRAP